MTKTPSRKKAQRGFTLIEAILVVTLVSIMGVALANLFTVGLRQSVHADFMTTAVGLANEKMEQILADKSGKGYPFIVADNYPAEWTLPDFPGYARTVSIQDTGEYKVVTVTVTHDKMVPVKLTTFLTNY